MTRAEAIRRSARAHAGHRPPSFSSASSRWRVIGVALALVLVGCGSAEHDPVDTTPPASSSSAWDDADAGDEQSPEPADDTSDDEAGQTVGALVATAVVDAVTVFAEPDGRAEQTHELEHPTEVGAPRVFLVDERRDGWLEVLLPVRPNGTTGWIREDDVELARNRYRIDIDLAEHRLEVFRDDEAVVETTIGYGAEDTPTPGGRYYVTELLQPPDPGGFYGPYAFGLSGFSDVHLDFAGGEGVIGIHGTNDPASIGERVSNGCIRVDNDVITELASFLPLGTPVTIG